MKWMKRALALLLGFLMLTNGGPISVFATDSVSDNDVAVETTAPIEPIEVCEECGGSDAHTDTCSLNIIAPLTTETPTVTTGPAITSMETTGATVSGNEVGCSECNQTEGHLDTCSQYINPIGETTETPAVCEICGQSGTHSVGCFATFTEVNQVGYFVSDSVTLYRNPTQLPDDTITLTSEQLPESFVVQYSFPGNDGVTWYVLDTENWNTDYSEYGYVNAVDVTFEDTSASTNQEVSKSLGTHTLTVSGMLLDGVGLDAAELEADMSVFVHSVLLGLDTLSEDEMALAYDISLQVGENKVQPDGTVTVKLDGLDTTNYTEFTVYHLPNTDIETVQRVMDGEDVLHDDPEVLVPTVGDGYIEFETNGFSVYYVVAGTSDDNSQYDTTIRDLPSENSTYYVEPGTIIEFSSGTFDGSGTTGITREGRTITVALDAVKGTSTDFKVERNNKSLTLTFIVSDRTAVIKGAIANHPVYLSILTSGGAGIPSEPGITDGDYKRYNSSYTANTGWAWEEYTFADTAEGIVSESITDQLIVSVDGSSTVGVYDATGSSVLSYLSGINWDTMLNKAVEANAVATDGYRVTNSNKANYIVIPYVVKLMAERGTGWHIDCVVVPANRITLSYDLNLKNYVITSTTLVLPNAVTSSTGEINTIVGSIQNAPVGQTLKASLNGEDYDVTFLGWSTDPNATTPDPSIDPGDSITVTKDTVLYAVWQGKHTSGTLKLQKTEVFEDVNDERKDVGASYTFTVTIANAEAGKSYPYTIYNADNTVKSAEKSLVSGGEIVLQAGEYAVVNNVPGGSVTVSESVATDSEFDVSWNVAGSKTEGSTVIASVTAGNQTEIVCVNTYSPLVADLTITKSGDITDENQSFIFYVKDSTGKLVNTVIINGTGSVTIKDLPLDTYTVTEDTNWSWRYTPTDGASKTITLIANGENDVKFNNNRSWIYWLSGDSYNENQFTVKSKDEEE